MASGPTDSPLSQESTSPLLIAVAAWAMPGLGYWLIGEKIRAVICGVCVLAIFLMGLLIGGVRVVTPPAGLGLDPILQKPWFCGQVLAGPIAIVSATAASYTSPDRESTSRSNEIGMLYTAIAGMLNLLVMMDAAHRSTLPAETTEPERATSEPGVGS